MKQINVDIVFEALTPVVHGETTIGNMQVIVRKKVRLPDGSFAKIPVVSGASMRQHMRRRSANLLLQYSGMGAKPDLTESALRLLFNGGMLSGRSDASVVKIDRWRKLMTTIPQLAMLGGCVDNSMLPGNIRTHDVRLICNESWALLPEWVREEVLKTGTPSSARAHIDEETEYKRDPKTDPRTRTMLSDDALARVESLYSENETARAANDAAGMAKTKTEQMPHSNEALCAGSLLHWHVSGDVYDELEEATFYALVIAAVIHARTRGVGGKARGGSGILQLRACRRAEMEAGTLKENPMEVFQLPEEAVVALQQHVSENASGTQAMLREVDA